MANNPTFNPDGREKINCRDYIHLMDELTTPMEFARTLRKYRKRIGEPITSYYFTTEDFLRTRFMTKYVDEL